MFGLTKGFSFASLDRVFLLVLGDVGIKICVVFLLAAAAVLMLHRSSAAMRHLVWMAAMVSFVVTPILSASVPKWRVLPFWPTLGYSALDGSQRQGVGSPIPTNETEVRRLEPSGVIGTNPIGPADNLANDLPAQSALGSSSILPPLSQLAFVVWMFGFCFLLLRTALSWLVLVRVSRSAESVTSGMIRDEIGEILGKFEIRRGVAACLSPQRGTPMTWGVLRTRLLLPSEASNWELRRLRAVLLHELAHVKRYDTFTHVFAQLVLANFWFHPLVWLAARRLHVECEFACDDHVLKSGVKASDYAEILLGILVPRSVPHAALAMTGQCDLESRLRAILDEKVDRRSITRCLVITASIVAFLATAAVASLQTSNQPTAKERESSPRRATIGAQAAPDALEKVTVLCVNSGGNPIVGAEVHLFQYTGPAEGGRFVQSGPFTTDERGRAVCSNATMYDGDKYDRWFYARVPGHLVGAGRTAKWTNRAAFNTEGRVVLKPSRVIEGRVLVPAGFDPTKVTVSVRTMQIRTGADAMDYESFTREDHFPGLDTALPGIFESRPDADGRIRFADVPERGRLYLVSRGTGLAEAQWSNDRDRDGQFREPIQMEIEEESLLSGRVLSPDGKPAAGMKVTARLSSSGRRQNAYLSSFNAISDDDGRFAIHGLPQTEFDLAVLDSTKSWSFRPMENLLVRPHQDPVLTLKMEVSVRVSGTVMGPDGKPVEGAAISAVADDHGGPGLAHDMTDATGHYELRLAGGDACFYFNSLPDGFEYPKPQIARRLQIKPAEGDVKNLDFTIERRAK
jgi:beta-lactamase regulating signal transducer with metallopeptidase domain